jgi:ribosomal protein S6
MTEMTTDAAAYELSFHILPTVAEGEVSAVADAIKQAIEAAGGSITSEEAPERFELAYAIDKYLEGRNRKFTSAYFGWVRFTLEPVAVADVTEALEGNSKLLRHLLIRLNKAELAHEFYFHEALQSNEPDTIDTDALETPAPAVASDEAKTTDDAADKTEDATLEDTTSETK